MFDGKAFGEQMVEVVTNYVDQATAPLIQENEALRRELADLSGRFKAVSDQVFALTTQEPRHGRDVDMGAVMARVDELVAAIPAPPPGRDADMDALKAHLDALVAAIPAPQAGKDADMDALKAHLDGLVAELPKPKDGEPGKDADPDVVAQIVAVEVGKAVAALPAPENGKDADIELVEQMVADAVAALPKPQDGNSITPEDVREMLSDMVQRAVSAIPPAKDGIGMAGAFKDHDGNLVITLSNGEVKSVGKVDGVDGKDVDMSEVDRLIKTAVDAIPRPKDGKDGFSLSDFDAKLQNDGRTLELSFEQGDERYIVELAIPVMIYRGVYSEGRAYEQGDTVTFGGALWHCNGGELDGQYRGATTEKPGDGNKSWTLAVRRGRDGKDFAGPTDRSSAKVKI